MRRRRSRRRTGEAGVIATAAACGGTDIAIAGVSVMAHGARGINAAFAARTNLVETNACGAGGLSGTYCFAAIGSYAAPGMRH